MVQELLFQRDMAVSLPVKDFFLIFFKNTISSILFFITYDLCLSIWKLSSHFEYFGNRMRGFARPGCNLATIQMDPLLCMHGHLLSCGVIGSVMLLSESVCNASVAFTTKMHPILLLER